MRDFRRTPEPRGGKSSQEATGAFVVQKHSARRVHYDFRIEVDGVLKSWAVTKEPTIDVGSRRLAIRTEDHPIEYAKFRGVISQGYGKGKVEIWDNGRWTPEGDPNDGLAQGKLVFALHGSRLRGRFALVRLRNPEGGKEAWLFIKRRDAKKRRRPRRPDV